MTKIFSADIRIWATAYIKAATAEEALQRLTDIRNSVVGLEGAEVSGLRFNDPNLPELSLSPAATICNEHIDSLSADELEEKE